MLYEFTGTESNTYTYGHRLLFSEEYKYILNAHGDVEVLIESDNTFVHRYRYDAFGNELNPLSTDTNPFRYCAEYFDVESGQIYLRNRYYQPVTGRFTQIDPIKDGLNWYAYCSNNPVAFVDPNGLDAIILTSDDSAKGAGHTSALYQNEYGEWYYTYWGDEAVAVVYIPKTYLRDGKLISSVDSLDNFNYVLNDLIVSNNYTGIVSSYEGATYIVGDFTASLDAAYKDVNDAAESSGIDAEFTKYGDYVFQGENKSYNLIVDNCVQRTYASLSKGTLDTGMNVGYYMHYLGFNSVLVPNSAENSFSKVFLNHSFTYSDAKKQAIKYNNKYNATALHSLPENILNSYALSVIRKG